MNRHTHLARSPDRSDIRRRSLAGVFAGLSFGLVAASAAALDAPCERELAEATELYTHGRLNESAALLETCLGGDADPPKRVQVRSRELLAKIYLANDDLAAADGELYEILALDPNYEPEPGTAPRFRSLVVRVRSETSRDLVSSVSKIPEDPRRAPATSEVVTGEEIARRGYLDLEAVLHDLPGFDISRTNGLAYSNIYQRGYRSPTTDRTLFLVDGVEHNDLTSNVAFLSRQYPLSNIERLEVVYGPASTLYGANAFVGVINIITKDPSAYLGTDENGRKQRVAVHAHLGGGAWNTRYVDATVAGTTADGDFGFALTARLYQSDEPDLSDFDLGYWDYDPRYFDDFDYGTLGFDADQAARARELDRTIYEEPYQGADIGFSDITDDSYISGKLRFSGFELGFQTWKRHEGSNPWHTDYQQPGARNGNIWVPEQTAFYIRYGRPISENLSAFLFSRYKVHGTTPDSSTFSLVAYATGRLKPEDLKENRAPYWKESILVRSSNQIRNELGFVYRPTKRFDLVAGVEMRNGSIQGDYARSVSVEGEVPPPPDEGGEHFDVRDLGAYAQASIELLPEENLKLVAGARFDHNEIRPAGGYGTAFNPRLAVIYSIGGFVSKAIYSEAFKDASNFNRFATSSTRGVPNPDLGAEQVVNTELSVAWYGNGLELGVTAYRAAYSNVVGLRQVPIEDDSGTPATTGQFQNLGALEIRGLQASLEWEPSERFDLYANYTYTDPNNTEPLDDEGLPRTDVDELRVGDIARHRINLGIHTQLRPKLHLDLRLNHVGSRQTGEGTTVPTNPFTEIEAYTVAHATLTYENVVRGLDLQVLVQNLGDELHAHPGVREAGLSFAPLVPQPERSVFLRATIRF